MGKGERSRAQTQAHNIIGREKENRGGATGEVGDDTGGEEQIDGLRKRSGEWRKKLTVISIMSEEIFVSRNNALVFAEHTLHNLEIIDRDVPIDSGFHPITQLINSLVGLVVFVHEREFVRHVADLLLSDLVGKGWPSVQIDKDDEKRPTKALGDFVRHLRNATAHGRISFSSDSRNLTEVRIVIEDYHPRATVPYWAASLTAEELRNLTLKMIDLLLNVTG